MADIQSLEEAQAFAKQHATDFGEQRMILLQARLQLHGKQTDAAWQLVSSLEIPQDEEDDVLQEDYLQTKMSIAMERDDSGEVVAICKAGLKRWPHSVRLKEILAERLAGDDPERSRTLLRDVLIEGEPEASTAWQYLALVGGEADVEARSLIETAPEERRERLAEVFAEVTAHHSMLQWNQKYLSWSQAQFPESDYLRLQLANHYHAIGKDQKAVSLARELHERNPDNPLSTQVLARCLMEVDPEEALPLLTQLCEQDRSIDHLFRLARCYSLLAHLCEQDRSVDRLFGLARCYSRANKIHWEILEQNPFVSASWTNLFLLEESRDKLWPYLTPMLKNGHGLEDQYFYVAAVKAATTLKRQLPPEWFNLAIQRYEILQTYPGFRDEVVRLKRALIAWISVRPHDAQNLPPLPQGIFDRFMARYIWPGQKWIPRDE